MLFQRFPRVVTERRSSFSHQLEHPLRDGSGAFDESAGDHIGLIDSLILANERAEEIRLFTL